MKKNIYPDGILYTWENRPAPRYFPVKLLEIKQKD